MPRTKPDCGILQIGMDLQATKNKCGAYNYSLVHRETSAKNMPEELEVFGARAARATSLLKNRIRERSLHGS